MGPTRIICRTLFLRLVKSTLARFIVTKVTVDSGREPSTADDLGSTAPHRPHRVGAVGAAHRRHVQRIAIADFVILVTAVVASEYLWLGPDADTIEPQFGIGYTKFGVLLAFVWWFGLRLGATRSRNVLGSSDEYQRIVRVTVTTFGVLAIIALLLELNLSRGYLAVAFPLGLVGLLFSRRTWRKARERQFSRGQNVKRVLVVGLPESANEIAGWFSRHAHAGLDVTGVWRPGGHAGLEGIRIGERFIPAISGAESLQSALKLAAADMVVVSSTDELGHHGLRDLTWDLEAAGIDLMLSPNLVAVAGSRISMRTVAGMPFVHVKKPQYAEAGNWPKLVFDRIGAAVILLLASPVFLVTALGVKLTSPGPIFYRQERVGRNGDPFPMIKFRSMRENADAELRELLEAQGTADAPLFKVEDDPRITKIGQIIRRYSIDELPQLINVLRGEMSLVGPRPQREGEVALYRHSDWRRLRVRPGMTGLWQVSGRSNLTWEEAIQLDMHYVENWSLMGDLQILARTLKAVLAKDGAV
ncbi:exopolysaccharide biosynthesis polyprenyl glycosylphosphotransferase [Aeromicrobium sp. 636]|nr:exopolysaccharide biosynthesis polyprenyl glycosylphosphotransferase [Aeromicrobium sp. 636]